MDVGIEVLKSIEKCSMHAIVACYHPLPLSACMLHFDLVFILFGTSIPTSFNILVKMCIYGEHMLVELMVKNDKRQVNRKFVRSVI